MIIKRLSKLKADEFFHVLIKLRLDLMLEDLACCFCVAKSTVCSIFNKWIEAIFICLKFFIVRPEKDIVKTNLPQIFKDLYPNTRCIIDCSEIFIERPLSYQLRAQTYSNYKKHNTVKILLAITPSGSIFLI